MTCRNHMKLKLLLYSSIVFGVEMTYVYLGVRFFELQNLSYKQLVKKNPKFRYGYEDKA